MPEYSNQVFQRYFNKPWYHQTWFIALLFSGSIFIFPALIGIFLIIQDTIETSEKKKRLEQLNLNKILALDEIEKSLANKIAHNIAISTLELTQQNIANNQTQLANLNSQISELNNKLIANQNEFEMQELGFFAESLDISMPAEYKEKIVSIKNQQKLMVRNKTASNFSLNYTFNGDLTKGKQLVMREVKIALWAFNTHCDDVITNVTYRNYALSEKKIRRALEIINANETLQSIKPEYLTLKLEELKTYYLYKQAVEKEKELLREQREKEREEKKLQQEIASELAKIKKDETHFNTELLRLQTLIQQENTDRESLIKEISDLQEKLVNLADKKKSINLRETKATAGYVYIVSNIGAFGEETVKIGVTRRLEPLERIKELGDASVPFNFDVHALIFSDEAFKLEHALHERFEKNRLNKINDRKEFFKLNLDELQKAIVEEFKGGSVNFELIPEAREYRESMKLN